ncbi:MAG: hypothetical protein E7602_05905 [Ruminococcaceae bacterium]|nr:hypothetical protein [Oscillospiraceae bacterium]
MKKKILLTALVVMAFVCLFAVSAFAEGIVVEKTEDAALGTIIKLSEDPGLDNAAQYASKLNNIEDSGDSAQGYCVLVDNSEETKYYYVFPSSYIVWENDDGKFEIYAGTDSQPGLAQAIAEFNSAKSTSYYKDYTISGTYGGRKLDALVRFEFPSDVTKIDANWCCMRSYSNLLEVRFNHSVNVSSAEKLFQGCAKLQTVVGFEKVTGSMPKGAFMNCSALKTVKLPTDITKISSSMFQSCKGGLNIENFSDLTNLTTIDSWAFDSCQNLVITLPDSVTELGHQAFCSAFKQGGYITINPTSQLTTIGDSAFGDCGKLSKNIYIPSTVTSIGAKAFTNYPLSTLENFENCQITNLNDNTFDWAKLTSIKIPASVTTISAKAFLYCEKLSLVYLPSTITSIGDTFVGSPQNAVYIFTGKDTSVFEGCTTLANANEILAKDYDETATYEGVNLVVGYSNCIAYKNGYHENYVSDEIIVGSYCEPIKVCNKCTDCDVIFGAGYELAAPFTYKGFSTDGESIVYDIKVNKEAIEFYNETTGGELKYGIVVSQIYNEGVLLNNDGSIIDNKILAIKLSEADFVSVQVKILNIAENLKTTPIHCCTYVIDGENVKYIYDVKDENGQPVVDAYDTANQVSYSQIAE